MITRSEGISTGLGYFVGDGYEGLTKELDDAVAKVANLLKKTFSKHIEIRYNSNRRSGGAFIKDNTYSDQIGLGAGLYNRALNSMTKKERMELSDRGYEDLPKDMMLLYHVVLADNLAINPKREDIYKYFKTSGAAHNWLLSHMNDAKVQEYLNNLVQPK